MTESHPPGGRLPLLSARPAVTSPAAERHRPLAGTKLYCLVTEAHRLNNLPKVVTQRCLEEDLNPRPTDRKPKGLTRCTTAPPDSHLVDRNWHPYRCCPLLSRFKYIDRQTCPGMSRTACFRPQNCPFTRGEHLDLHLQDVVPWAHST